MLWFDHVRGEKWRKTEPELTSQVSASLVLFSVQLESVAAAARLLATGTRGSSSRGHHTPVSVPLCLCPRRLAGWLAKPTRRVLASLTRRANTPPPPPPYLPYSFFFFFFSSQMTVFAAQQRRIIHDVFGVVWNPWRNIVFYPHYHNGGPPVLREKWKKKGTQCSMHVLHSSGAPRRRYCISCVWNVFRMIYKRVTRLQASACDCVGQPLSSAERFNCYIVNGAEHNLGGRRRKKNVYPRRALRCIFFIYYYPTESPPGWVSFRTCIFRVFLLSFVLALISRPLPPSSGEDFVCTGRGSMNASAEVLPPFPPPSTSTSSLAKQEQLLLGKRKGKKSSWSFKRHGITLSAKSCPVRRWDFRGEVVGGVWVPAEEVLVAEFWRCIFLRTSSSGGRLWASCAIVLPSYDK